MLFILFKLLEIKLSAATKYNLKDNCNLNYNNTKMRVNSLEFI